MKVHRGSDVARVAIAKQHEKQSVHKANAYQGHDKQCITGTLQKIIRWRRY